MHAHPRLVFGFALVAALAACQPAARTVPDAADAPAAPTSMKRATVPEVPEAPQSWPTSLVLAIGEEVPLAGGKLKLLRIAADSRCPKGAQCIWAGEVTLAFAYTGAGAPREFQLSERTTPRTSLGSHDIELTGFGPCPAGHTPASAAGCATVAFRASQTR